MLLALKFEYQKKEDVKMKKTMIVIALMMVSVLMFGLTVDGYVIDADNGEAIDGATVRFIYVDGTCSGGSGGSHGSNGGGGNNGCNGINVVTVTTDENGYYLISDLTEGIYDAIAAKPGSYPSVRIEDFELIEDTSIDFELTGGTCEPPARILKKSYSRKL